VFDYQTQDQLYRDLHALAQQNGSALGAPVPVAPAPEPKPVEAKILATSKKNKKSNKQAQA
jgi:hypothetical protein